MKKTYFVRCMKNHGGMAYSIITDKKIVFTCTHYSELVDYLKVKLMNCNKLGIQLIIKVPQALPSLEDDVYSY